MVSEDNYYKLKTVQRTPEGSTGEPRYCETSGLLRSSPVIGCQGKSGGSSQTVYGNGQEVRVVYEVSSGDVRTMENRAPGGDLHQVTSGDGQRKVSSSLDVVTNGRGPVARRDQRASTDSISVLLREASSSQPLSWPEDNSTDAHGTLTETMTFLDGQTIDESGEMHSLLGVMEVHVKEFVLIDDDDDGDMSLREKTVTDLSVMDGNAADLVCGRLLSITTDTSSECKEGSLATEPRNPAQTESHTKMQRCCFCSIL